MNPTIETRRQKLEQLQALRDSGAIGAEADTESRTRLEAELVDVVISGDGRAEQDAKMDQATRVGEQLPSRASRRLRLGLSMGVLALAAVGYALTGSPGGIVREPTTIGAESAVAVAGSDGGPSVTAEQVAEIVDRIAQRLKEKPDDPTGWALLARAYSAMGRYTEAVPAFRKALALAGEDASLIADFADVLAAQNSGKLEGEAGRMIERALELEPDNVKALALSGSVAFDRRDYAGALRQWERVERVLPSGNPFLAEVRASIAQARELGGLPADTPANMAVGARACRCRIRRHHRGRGEGWHGQRHSEPRRCPGSAGKSKRHRIRAGARRRRTAHAIGCTAQTGQGPAAAFHARRRHVDGTGAKLSDHARVVVSARISKSGDALARPGDLTGRAAAVAPGASGVAVRISEVIGQ